MPLAPALALWLCSRGHGAVHAAEIGLHRAPDSEIMARAKQEARTIVTADLDYPHHLAMARATEPSVIPFRDGNWSDAEIITRIGEVLTALAQDDIAHSIIVVERSRVRRRRLPLGS